MATKVVTGEVRASFFHGWEPTAMEEGQQKKYSVTCLIDKTTREGKATISAIEEAMEEAIATQKDKKWGGKIPPDSKLVWPLKEGEEERPEDENYVDMMVIKAASIDKPGIVDQDVLPILDQSEVYSGCYIKVSMSFYLYDFAGKKGVGCALNNIQKVRDGESLGGTKASAEDDFSKSDKPAATTSSRSSRGRTAQAAPAAAAPTSRRPARNVPTPAADDDDDWMN